MKKVFLSLIILLVSMASWAQEELGNPKYYTVPAVFTPTDRVTIYFDMAESGFQDGVDLYLWCWQPTEPDAGNFDNSSDFAKLTYLGEYMYSMTIVPVDYFFQNQDRFATKDELLAFMNNPDEWGEAGYWSRLKLKDGSKQSGVFCINHTRDELNEFKESGSEMKVMSGSGANSQYAGYTDKWTMDRPLSILFNGDLVKVGGKTLNELGAAGIQVGTHAGISGIYTDLDDNEIDYDFVDPPAKNINQQWNTWRQGCLAKAGLRDCGNGVWKWDLETPQRYFSYNPVNADENPVGTDATYGPYILTDGGKVGADGNPAPNPEFFGSFVAQSLKFGLVLQDWSASVFDLEFKAGTAEAYPDPVFSYFPSKFSQNDILTLTRQYNGRTDKELKYTIEAGSKTFSGVMGGDRDKREAVINLLSELQGVSATSIKVTITNEGGATVVETELPLVPLDEITNE